MTLYFKLVVRIRIFYENSIKLFSCQNDTMHKGCIIFVSFKLSFDYECKIEFLFILYNSFDL